MDKNIVKIKGLTLKIWDDLILDNISFNVREGEITCLAGESGSGKSTCVGAILRELPIGTSFFDNECIKLKGSSIFSIYQDPINSFNPSIKVGRQLYFMAKGYRKVKKKEFKEEISRIMFRLKFVNPEEILKKYPFELSGGMLQRLMIATAIFVRPDLLIADEPTTALDVNIQKEMMKYFREINREYKITMLVVTHDLGVVAEIADQVIIMQNGKIIERGNVFDIFDNPKEEYTKDLLTASFKLEEEGDF